MQFGLPLWIVIKIDLIYMRILYDDICRYSIYVCDASVFQIIWLLLKIDIFYRSQID